MDKDLVAFWSAIIGGTIGGLITGIFTLYGVQKTYENEINKQKSNQNRIIIGLIQALSDEVEALWGAFSREIGKTIENLGENDPLLITFPLLSDYFIVFNSNASLIGHIEDSALRKSIVKTYAEAKSMVDALRINNELVNRYDTIASYGRITKLEESTLMAAEKYEDLKKYSKEIKYLMNQLKIDVPHLLALLAKPTSSITAC